MPKNARNAANATTVATDLCRNEAGVSVHLRKEALSAGVFVSYHINDRAFHGLETEARRVGTVQRLCSGSAVQTDKSITLKQHYY